MIDLKSIKQVDPELYASMLQELERQQHNLELIASENIVSEAVLAAAGTFYTNKYAEGYPGKRYYGGCEYVDVAEKLAIERAKQLFGVKYANVQPHCGSNANFAAYYALLSSGDTILGMTLADGGHLTHGAKVNMSGKLFNCVGYGIDPQTELINYDEVRRIALECKPKLIVAGASAYPRFIDYKKFREIADEVGAYLMADIAHVAGMVAVGLHPSPVGYAHVITSTTHKTLRGPRGGLILCDDEDIAKKIDKAIFPGSQGGPLMHIIAAKAVAFKEALSPEFKTYQEQILKNAKVHRAILDSDVWINVPVLKHHGGANLTISMKNLMGIVWDRGAFHRDDLQQCIADICTLQKKPALNVVDAYRVMKTNGPRGQSADDVVLAKGLFVSPDIVAVDTAATKFFNQIREMPMESVGHLANGQALNIGTTDLDKLNVKRIKL